MTTLEKPTHRRFAWRRAPWVWALAVAALFSLVQLPYAPGSFYPDSTEYLTQVYGLLGDSPADGREKTIQAYCDQYRHKSLVLPAVGIDRGAAAKRATACVRRLRSQNGAGPGTKYGPAITDGEAIPSTRYENIFLSRPGVAVLYLPGVAIFGPRAGMWLTTLFWTLLGSVLAFLLLRRLGAAPGVALLGQVLYLILPMRPWMMTPLSEGMTVGLTMACLLGAVYALTGARRLGVGLLVAGFGIGAFVKYSQFLLLAAALAGVMVVTLLVKRRSAARQWRDVGVVSGVAVLCAGAMVLLSHVLGWPGGIESMQDLLTGHFGKPDVADPVGGWLSANSLFWQLFVSSHVQEPFLLVAWAAGAWGVFRYNRTAGYVVLAAWLAGMANQVGHPSLSQGDRIYILAWLLTVCGVPLLLHTFLTRRAPGPAERPAIPAQREPGTAGVPGDDPLAEGSANAVVSVSPERDR